jgi:hypothetical protein
MFLAVFALLASEARAACSLDDTRMLLQASRLPLEGARPAALAGAASATGHGSIVGLWQTSFLVGNGPEVAYQGFQQWHVGGTEVMVDNGVPPSLGNVCVGVWKHAGRRTYKLRHTTFNWDAEGNRAGTFVMLMTVTLDRRGHAFTGTYVADSFDLNGTVIPELHAEGAVRSERITVD